MSQILVGAQFLPDLLDVHNQEALFQRTREVPQLSDLTFVHTLVIESTYE